MRKHKDRVEILIKRRQDHSSLWVEMERFKKRMKPKKKNGGGKYDEEAEFLGGIDAKYLLLKL